MDILYSMLTDEEIVVLSESRAATAATSTWKRITCIADDHSLLSLSPCRSLPPVMLL
jgi:hypothetical protein